MLNITPSFTNQIHNGVVRRSPTTDNANIKYVEPWTRAVTLTRGGRAGGGGALCVKGPGWDVPVEMACGNFIMLVNDMQINANKHVGGASRSVSCGIVCSNRNASVFPSERLRRRTSVYLTEPVYSVFTKWWQMQPMFAPGEVAVSKPGTGLSVKAFYPPSPLQNQLTAA